MFTKVNISISHAKGKRDTKRRANSLLNFDKIFLYVHVIDYLRTINNLGID